MNAIELYEELKATFGDESAKALTRTLLRIHEEIVSKATKEDFKELKGIVEELAESQKRTEQKVGELAETQKRTEQKVGELTESHKELAEAQKRTEQKVGELAESHKELAESHKELAESHKELAEAQKLGFQKVNDQISALGSRWGIKNEVMIRNTIKDLLKKLGYTTFRGYYGGREVDVIIRNGEHILLEITSSALKKDVRNLNLSAEDYYEKHKVNPRLVLASIYISPVVMREITESPRKIDIYSGDEEEEDIFV